MNPLQTPRLTLRSFEPDDWRHLQVLAMQQHASEYAVYDHEWPTSEEKLRGIATSFSADDSLLAVCLRETGTFIGLVSLNRAEGEQDVAYDLGYRFDEGYHGQGYATEACLAVMAYAFEDLGAARLTSGTAAANEASCRLLARLGFTKTGEQVGSFWKTPDGRPIEFLGYSFEATRGRWAESPARSR